MNSSSKRFSSVLALLAIASATPLFAQSKPIQTKNGNASVTYVENAAPAKPAATVAAPAASAPANTTVAQNAAPAPTAQPAQPAQAEKPAQPEIKDQAEYNTYANALGQADPRIRAAQLEAYLQLYPNSVVKEDALTGLLKAYQQSNDAPHLTDAASRLLAINPKNVTALALMAYNSRNAVLAGGASAADAANQCVDYGKRGLDALSTWRKPDPKMSDAEFQGQKDQLAAIFNAALGLGALNAKDYTTAQKALQAAVDAGPNDLTNVYYLAIAYLTPKPVNPTGLWYAARAVNLSNHNKQIYDYGHSKYLRYHSPDKSDDHWDDVVAAAAAAQPPAGFVITPAPTDKEIAGKMAANLDPKKISLGELEYIFLYAEPAVAQDVVSKMKGEDVAFSANVIEVAPEKLMLAATEDAIAAGKADVELTMVEAIPAKYLPKVGTQAVVVGQISGFQANPFQIQMAEGKLAAKPEAPKKPTPKKPASRSTRRR